MTTRTNYPTPHCPRCGAAGSDSRIKETYYTPDREIVRIRRCSCCNYRWTTLQPEEVILPVEEYKVISTRNVTRVTKQVTIQKL